MMTSVPSEIVSRYSGELRKDGDHRESQILFEYDSTFNLLYEVATMNDIELPLLFKKQFIDHGAVTGCSVFVDRFTVLNCFRTT